MMKKWDGESSAMEIAERQQRPIISDIDQYTDEAYSRLRDEWAVDSIIEKAKGQQQ